MAALLTKGRFHMSNVPTQSAQLAGILQQMSLPGDMQIRSWMEADMPHIQHLSDVQNWPTHHTPDEVLASWRNAWPALVAMKDERIVGYVRGLTDEHVITHITDLLVADEYRKQGIGRLLIRACSLLFPRTVLVLVAEKAAIPFYTTIGFRSAGEAFLLHPNIKAKGE